jgi:hypothetical protein
MKTTELWQIVAQCGHVVVFTLLIGASSLLQAAPLGRAFTYQGRLNDGGTPANVTYDLKFTLCDSESGLIVINAPLTNAATAVSNGLFTVTLDFGPGVFTGEARWLDIRLRTNGSPADFTRLAPRQPLTPNPYALHAPSAGMANTANTAISFSSPLAGDMTGAQGATTVASVGGQSAANVATGASAANCRPRSSSSPGRQKYSRASAPAGLPP